MRFRAEIKINSTELNAESLEFAKQECIDLIIIEVKKKYPALKEDDIRDRVKNGIKFDVYDTASSLISIHDQINARASLESDPMCYVMAEFIVEDQHLNN